MFRTAKMRLLQKEHFDFSSNFWTLNLNTVNLTINQMKFKNDKNKLIIFVF